MIEPPRHIPVLLAEVMEALAPRPGAVIVDGTFGAGGYTSALLDRGADVVALDRDPSAVNAGARLASESDGRLRLVEARFGALEIGRARPRARFGGRGGVRHRRLVDAAR